MATHDEDPGTEEIIERLEERFPGSDADHVKEVVEHEEERFASAPVRDFVPVLVEREARDQLRSEGYEDEGPGAVVIPESERLRESDGYREMEDVEDGHGQGRDFELDEGRGIPDASGRAAAARAEAKYGALGAGSVDDFDVDDTRPTKHRH